MSAKSVPLADATRPLRIARALIEVLAPRASVSWFSWWKEPGNRYVTLFPTELLPAADEPVGLGDAQIGQQLFSDVVCGDHGSVTLGMYGGPEVHVPWLAPGVEKRVWPPPAARGLPPLPGGLTTPLTKREEVAVRAAFARMDTGWLQARGRPDPVASSEVLSLDEQRDRAAGKLPSGAPGLVGR
ncbi:MAG: hypothetical protein IPL61_19665 [Myxococcales bacterium]|nr:hypothetical protein [Myxococcales bacterium]